MSDWRVAKSLEVLREQLNTKYPLRPTGADGSIGDARHAATKSDHNPVKPHPGIVTARDFTTDDDITDGNNFTDDLFDGVRKMLKNNDGRVKYAIYKGKITNSDGSVSNYSGFSQHFDHVHISVSNDPKQYDRTDPWPVLGWGTKKEEKPDMDHDERKWLADTAARTKATDARLDKMEDVLNKVAEQVNKLASKA